MVPCYNTSTQYLIINDTIFSYSSHGYTKLNINYTTITSLNDLRFDGIPITDDFGKWIYDTKELTHHDINDLILNTMEKDFNDRMNNEVKNTYTKWWNIFGIFNINGYSIIFTVIQYIERIGLYYLIYRYIILQFIKSRTRPIPIQLQRHTPISQQEE